MAQRASFGGKLMAGRDVAGVCITLSYFDIWRREIRSLFRHANDSRAQGPSPALSDALDTSICNVLPIAQLNPI